METRLEEAGSFFFYIPRIQLARLFLKPFLSSISRREVFILPLIRPPLLRFTSFPSRAFSRDNETLLLARLFHRHRGGATEEKEYSEFIPTRIDGERIIGGRYMDHKLNGEWGGGRGRL